MALPETAVPGLARPTGRLEGSGAQDGSFVWGVDPSTLRLAIVAAGARGLEPRTHSFTRCKPKTGERLRVIHAETLAFGRTLAAEFPPVRIFVEQPFAYGRQVEPELFYAVGVVQAALAELAPVGTIGPQSWKKETVGHGHAKKDDVMAWARRDGYQGRLQDEADAWAIARAGQRRLEPKPEQLLLA